MISAPPDFQNLRVESPLAGLLETLELVEFAIQLSKKVLQDKKTADFISLTL